MYKVLFLFLLISLNISCKSDDDCPETFYANTQPAMYLPNYYYIYATEATEPACYQHGLEVIGLRNAYESDYNSGDSCKITTLVYYYQPTYKMDTIPRNFTQGFESLNALEIEELTNLICGREIGNESYKIQSLDSYQINDQELHVEFTINDEVQFRNISARLDESFNCPLYSFSCYEKFPEY